MTNNINTKVFHILLIPIILCLVTLCSVTQLTSCTKTKPNEIQAHATPDSQPRSRSNPLSHTTHPNQNQNQSNPNTLSFFVPLGSLKQHSNSVLKVPETRYGIDMFCEDDFTSLPSWSIVYGTPKPLSLVPNALVNFGMNNSGITASETIDFDKAFMTFDAQNHLQRSVLTITVMTEKEQQHTYDLLSAYFDNLYTQDDTPPLFSTKMPTNEVIKGYYESYYLGHVYEDVSTYRTSDGYLLLYRRTKGEVIPPDSMRFSLNGVFAEYVNLGKAQPVWVEAMPKKREVVINHYSADFAAVYEQHCH